MKKTFLVALHAQSMHQVLLEAKKILTPNGAHGVLIVNNGGEISATGGYPNLFDVAVAIKDRFPNYMVGINPLDLSIAKAIAAMGAAHATYWELEIHSKDKNILDMLWTDDSGIIEVDGNAVLSSNVANEKLGAKADKTHVPHYASIAFKYKTQPKNLEAVAKCAAKEFEVVVTSGNATGAAADVDKIKYIKSLVGDTPLALASGLTRENLSKYLLYIDICIVGTSLLKDPKNQFVYSQQKAEEFRTEIEKY